MSFKNYYVQVSDIVVNVSKHLEGRTNENIRPTVLDEVTIAVIYHVIGWRDGSVVKSMYFASRRPKFNSQHRIRWLTAGCISSSKINSFIR